MTPEEYGRHLASMEPPISRETAIAAARIFAAVEADMQQHTTAGAA